MISKIEAQNIKGRSFFYNDLGPVNVILGDNWSGKTSVLSAIRLGLLGYDPALGKRPGDTVKLATGDEMKVNLTLDGCKLSRTWKMSRGKCSRKDSVPDSWKFPSMLLDIGDWFALTAQQRRDHLLSSLSVDMTEVDQKIIEEVNAIYIEPAYEEHHLERNELIESLEFWIEERDHTNQSIADWFSHQLEIFKERLAEKKLVDEQQAALLRTIAQERSAVIQAVPVDQKEILVTLNDERDRLMKDIGVAQSRQKSISGREMLEKLISEMPDSLVSRLDELFKREKQLAIDYDVHSRNAKDLHLLRKLVSSVEGAIENVGRKHAELSDRAKEITDDYERSISAKCCAACGREGLGKRREHIEANYKAAKSQIGTETMSLVREKMEAEEKLEDLKGKLSISEDADVKAIAVGLELQEVRGEITHLKSDADRLSRYRKQLEELASEPRSEFDLEQLYLQITDVESRIEQAEELQSRRSLMMERNAQEATALDVRDNARRTIEVVKEAIKILERVQAETIVDAFDPFVSKVRQFTDGLLGFELSHRDGDLGYVGKRGQWVSHETFSGAEKAMTYAGLGVALASKCPIRVILIDEVLISKANKERIGNRLQQLVTDGELDQAFICDTSMDGWPITAMRIDV